MKRKMYRISLDMFEVVSQATIKAKRGDTACSIYITLMENGKIYHITDGCEAVFSAKKPDGNYLFTSKTCRIEDNTIIYDFTEQTTPIEGVVECEVILKKDERTLTSPRFNILVDGTVYNGEEIVSTTEVDSLKILMDKVKIVIENVETKLSNGDFVGDKGDKGDKGEKGDKGDKGEDGYTPQKGIDYFTEADNAELVRAVIESLGGNPIFGYVDKNNNIVVQGSLADGTYSVKYEMEDGSIIDIGKLSLASTPEAPTYTNLLPLSVDANDNDYRGDNGEDGYKTGSKISTSTGNESTVSTVSACVSGFIKLAEGVHSQIRIKNITLSSGTTNNNVVFYHADKTLQNGYAGPAGTFNSEVEVTNGVYLVKTTDWFTVDNLPTYFRFSCGEITDETIVTVNQEIV